MQQLVHAIGSGSGRCEASLFTCLCSVREDLVVVDNLADDLKTDACFYEIENLKTLGTLSEIPSGQSSFLEGSYDDDNYRGNRRDRVSQKPNIKMFVSRIREQFQKFSATDHLWWRGLARILEDKGFIKEGDDKIHVQIKFPEPTKMGLEFLQTNGEQPFYVYPEADMLLSTTRLKPYSSFAEWGKGWADPEIRRQRLERKRSWRSPRKRKSRKRQPDLKTVRGRLAAKLSK